MSDTATLGVVCTTPACVHIASEMLWALAPNYTEIGPCTDFDMFACAGWESRREIPSGDDSVEVLPQVQQDVYWNIKQILEGPYPTGSDVGWVTASLSKDQVEADREILATARQTYHTWMDQTAIEKAGLHPLVDFVKNIANMFPIDAESNTTDPEAFINTVIELQRWGITTFFTPDVTQDEDDPTTFIPLLDGPSFSSLSGITSNSASQEFLNLTTNLLQAVHPANISLEVAANIVKAVTDFTGELVVMAATAIISNPAVVDVGAKTPRTSLKELDESAPILGLSQVVKSLVPDGYQVNEVQTSSADYFKNASELVAAASPELLQDFFIWHTALTLAEYAESPVTMSLNNLREEQGAGKISGRAARWHMCTRLLHGGVKWAHSISGVTNTFTFALTRFFLDKHCSEETRDFTKQMVQTLGEEPGSRILDKSWIANQTKAAAKSKVDKISANIGFPDWVLDPHALRQFYKGLKITDSYFGNTLAMSRFATQKTWDILRKPLDRKTFWPMSPLTTNAFYNPLANNINILAGIQQFPLFDYEFPSCISYGGMGSIIGHEITHSFDNRGRYYDGDGDKSQWWDNATIAAFEKRTECFVGNFTVHLPNGTDVRVSGTLANSREFLQAFNCPRKEPSREMLFPGRAELQFLPFFLSSEAYHDLQLCYLRLHIDRF